MFEEFRGKVIFPDAGYVHENQASTRYLPIGHLPVMREPKGVLSPQLALLSYHVSSTVEE